MANQQDQCRRCVHASATTVVLQTHLKCPALRVAHVILVVLQLQATGVDLRRLGERELGPSGLCAIPQHHMAGEVAQERRRRPEDGILRSDISSES